MKRYFEQRQIKEHSPDVGDFSKSSIKLYIKLDDKFSITYSTISDIEATTVGSSNDYQTDALDFAIWASRMTVEMYLEDTPDGVEWRWSRTLDGFTTKDIFRRRYYGHLHYKENKNDKKWIRAPKWLDDQKKYYRPSKALMFKALRAGGKEEGFHAFSLNIEIKQKDGKWLPITIDPDVRNPPTRPGRYLIDSINDKIKEGANKNFEEKIFLFDSSIKT